MPRIKVATSYAPKVGSAVRFAPAGRVIETVTVSKTEKPAGADLADWEELGCIETGTVSLLTEAGEPVYCFNLTTGEDEQIRTGDTDAHTQLQFDLTLQAVTDYLWQLALGAKSVHPDTGAFVPGSLPGGAVQGWAIVQVQISLEKVAVMHLWVEVKPNNPATIRHRTAGYKPQVQVTQLKAALESGVLGTAAE